MCTKKFMRSDHLAKHTKTHENKAKKLLAKKGDKLEKAAAAAKNANSLTNPTAAVTTIIKQEKIDEDEVKPPIFHPSATLENGNYMDVGKNLNYNESTATTQSKPSLEDYYQSYHPYQYQYGSNYFHQNSRFYQDKNYFYGLEQNRGMFPSPTTTVAAASANSSPTQLTINPVQSQHQQGGFYQQSSSSSTSNHHHHHHYTNGNTSGISSNPNNGTDSNNYLLNFNASINNTININTSNLMININNTSTNNNSTTSYHSQALQQQH